MPAARRSLPFALLLVLTLTGCGSVVSATSSAAIHGQPFAFEMGHCGINSPIDFDGSLWRPVDSVPSDEAYQSHRGTVTILGANEAEFRSEEGFVLPLRRLNGPQVLPGCA